jgi:hypothetical protein
VFLSPFDKIVASGQIRPESKSDVTIELLMKFVHLLNFFQILKPTLIWNHFGHKRDLWEVKRGQRVAMNKNRGHSNLLLFFYIGSAKTCAALKSQGLTCPLSAFCSNVIIGL